MTLIEIPDDQAAAWKARAEAEGLTLEAWLAKLANAQVAPRAANGRRHISDVIRERMASVPAEAWDGVPEDGASQHDHYIYGLPETRAVTVFADTFYWIALTDSKEADHGRATQITEDIVTTDEVLTEYLTFFCRASESLRREVAANVQDILQESHILVIPQSHDTFLSGLALYRDRPDKGYSLVDCISMQAMRRLGLTAALTNDRHFEQEGFQALFR